MANTWVQPLQEVGLRMASAVLELGTGLGLGVVSSLIFFGRGMWPLAFGSGERLRLAYANCQRDCRLHAFYTENMSKEQWSLPRTFQQEERETMFIPQEYWTALECADVLWQCCQPRFQLQSLLMRLKPSLLFSYLLFGKEVKKKKRTIVFDS